MELNDQVVQDLVELLKKSLMAKRKLLSGVMNYGGGRLSIRYRD